MTIRIEISKLIIEYTIEKTKKAPAINTIFLVAIMKDKPNKVINIIRISKIEGIFTLKRGL